MDQNVYILHANCIVIKGHTRTSICDLQRNKVYLVANSLARLFDNNRILRYNKILVELAEEDKNTFNEYLDFLLENELVLSCSENVAKLFKRLPDKWLFPSKISNCIIDIKTDLHFNKGILDQLISIQCYHIQYRFFRRSDVTEIVGIFSIIESSPLKSVEIILPFSQESINVESMSALLMRYKKIGKIIIYNYTSDQILLNARPGVGYLLGMSQQIDDQTHCGIVNADYFSINIPTYTESLKYNTCLNRKISIDIAGNIKNCPSMERSFGNIRDTTLAEAIEEPGYKAFWKVTKDEITKCKDCEFRHICTDCRAYIEHPEDAYSAPLKCGYDPYTCEWSEWSNNPLKQHAIQFYGFKGQ